MCDFHLVVDPSHFEDYNYHSPIIFLPIANKQYFYCLYLKLEKKIIKIFSY